MRHSDPMTGQVARETRRTLHRARRKIGSTVAGANAGTLARIDMP